jgi:hypothetical protein
MEDYPPAPALPPPLEVQVELGEFAPKDKAPPKP